MEYVLHLDSHMIPRRSSLLTRQMALKNWKKGKERIEEHERGFNHRNASKESRRNQPDVACQIDHHYQEQQHLRRTGLVAHLDTMKTLLRQGLAIRGHRD